MVLLRLFRSARLRFRGLMSLILKDDSGLLGLL